MKTYIVQLDNQDDVVSTRDKISWSKAQRVLLVWPRSGHLLDRRVDLMLLQRHCQQLGVQMAIVTRRAEVIQHARDLGIPTFSRSLQAQQVPWRRPSPRRRSLRPEGQLPPDTQALRAQREQFTPRPFFRRWVQMVSFVVGVLAFLALALFFVPAAQVKLQPVRREQAITIAAWADPQVTQANPSGALPAHRLRVEVEGRETASASGLILVDQAQASGSVLLTNLTDRPVAVPVDTALLTLDAPPIRFVTTRAVDLPAGTGQTAQAPVRAELPGTRANVAAGAVRAVEGAVGLQVSVDNPEAMTGGTERTSPAPTESDYRALRARLLEQLKSNALEELQAQMQPGQRLLLETLRLSNAAGDSASAPTGAISEERQPVVGQPGEQLQLTLRVQYEGWYIEERDVQAVAQRALDAVLAPGFRPVGGTLNASFTGEPLLDENDIPRWTLQASRTLEADWSPEIATQMILGRSPQEAAQILQSAFLLTGAPDISLYPAWWLRLPYLPFRISVVQS